MPTIAISGASGFVGSNLRSFFEKKGFTIVPLGKKDFAKESIKEKIESAEVIINLAGAPIVAKWTEEYKKEMYASRINTTQMIVDAIEKMEEQNRPKLLISTSAVGIYDNKGIYTEEDRAYSDDFLGRLAYDWEKTALKAEEFCRVVIFRFGIVLGENGGMIEKIRTPFKLGVGGTIGDGSQKLSWVHVEDIARGMEFVREHVAMEGVYNMTAPEPTTNRAFTKTAGRVLHRPTPFPVPVLALRALYGEGAKVMSDGQAVRPKRLLDAGFRFEHGELEEALRASL